MVKFLSQMLRIWVGVRHMLRLCDLHHLEDTSLSVVILTSWYTNTLSLLTLHLVMAVIWYGPLLVYLKIFSLSRVKTIQSKYTRTCRNSRYSTQDFQWSRFSVDASLLPRVKNSSHFMIGKLRS